MNISNPSIRPAPQRNLPWQRRIQKLIGIGFWLCGVVSAICQSPAETVWSIGQSDDQAGEFALAPDQYAQFLQQDFGWENRFYIIGRSQPDQDWPYVLPGPDDSWAGSGGVAGSRTQRLNILFELANRPPTGTWRLVVDLVDTHAVNPPLLKITVNGRPWKFRLKPGAGDASISGDFAAGREQVVALDLPPDLIRPHANQISFVGLEGSWMVFDAVRLEGPAGVRAAAPGPVFLRSIKAADYEIEKEALAWQPMLVDVECLEPNTEVEVKLDDKSIFSRSLDLGRAVLEVPMPSKDSPGESTFEVFANRNSIRSGRLQRGPQPPITPADYVDPMMGAAHSRWMIAPGPWMPFSMVKLSPDNQNAGWQAGYDPHIENIAGFSHIHEWTMAGLLMMPVNGPLRVLPGDQYKPDAGYRSRIDKTREQARLGYYRAFLTDYGIDAELTATTRAGFQRYTFTHGASGRVMIDLQFPAEYDYHLEQVDVRQISDRILKGFAVHHAPNVWGRDAQQEYTLHFVIEFDHSMTALGAWTEAGIESNVTELRTGAVADAGLFAEFDVTSHRTVQARTGLSLVDTESAHRNLRREITEPFGWDFDAVRHHQREAWNNLLGRIAVETPDRREKVRFYTNLYRSFCRNIWSDRDGGWCDPAEQIRRLDGPEDVMLGCDAFWNTFWNLNQVWNLIAPEWSSRWVRSQLALYDAGGWLAKGPAGLEYIPVMVAEHEIPLIVGAYQMGIRNFDAEMAFEAVLKMQRTPGRRVHGGFAGNRDLEAYLHYHYVPADRGRVSNTLEYAFDDWAVAQFAKSLGREAEYREFLERSTWWKNTFDPDTGFARMRNANGKWVSPFDPFRSGANEEYVEGNAWQLTFFVPQNVPGLIEAIGKQRFLDRLRKGFAQSAPTRFNAPNEQYWAYPVVHGNQQSMHFAFLFNWAGAPWLTQYWSREILNRYYGYGTGDAYLGDEDQGQMSAWFVMAALGLFQMDGGCRTNPIYEIGSPLFERTTIHLNRDFYPGESFTIEARHTSHQNRFIQSATLNGQPLNRPWFPHTQLLHGGSLVLEMGPEPNRNWGAAPTDTPPIADP